MPQRTPVAPLQSWRLLRIPGVRVTGILGVVACVACTGEQFEAAAPVARPDSLSTAAVALPDLPPSVIDAPISIALDPALRALERVVPPKFGDISKKIENPNNKRQQVAFEAKRSPFKVQIDGQHLTLETIIEYEGRGWYNPPIGPTVGASCGKNGEQPRIRVVLSSDLGLTRSWRVNTHTTVEKVEPYSTEERDHCRVTFLSFDVTERVLRSVRELLDKQLPLVDQKLAAFDLRSKLEKWYNLLNKQIKVKDSLWLVLNPGEVRFGGIRANDDALIFDVRLFAEPRIYSGEQRERPVSPLPPMVRAARRVGDSLHVRLDAILEYDVASAILQKQLRGRHFRRFGRSVRIENVQLYGLGDGRVVMSLLFHGAIDGRVYLVGTPRLDPLTSMLYVPDLDFDVSTSNGLAKGVTWLTRGDVVAELRRRARVPLSDVVDRTRERVQKAMNRDLTKGVHLEATLHTGRLLDVVANKNDIFVRADLTGALALNIDRELPVKIRPKIK